MVYPKKLYGSVGIPNGVKGMRLKKNELKEEEEKESQKSIFVGMMILV